jgi:phospholipid/cholesterol/gamma-HCH transport system ATP-binding protein
VKQIFAVDGVDVRYGQKLVLANCTLDIFPGVTCVMGQSGTGKSTLLKAIIGLEEVERGHIYFDDRDITQLNDDELATLRHDMAFVFQGGALFSSITVFENCALALRERDHLRERDISTRVTEALERVGLSNAAQRFPDELSGGMMKRAAIARSLAMRPRVMMFDEPTTGADPVTTAVLMGHIQRITDTTPVASIVVTHDVNAIRRFADRAVLLFEGNAIWEGSPADMDASQNPILQQFISGSVEGPIPV